MQTKTCSKCGQVNPKHYLGCTGCGEMFEKEESGPPPPVGTSQEILGGQVCPKCSHRNPNTRAACINCGTVFEKARLQSARRREMLDGIAAEQAVQPASGFRARKPSKAAALIGVGVVVVIAVAVTLVMVLGGGPPPTQFAGAPIGEGKPTLVLLHDQGKVDDMVQAGGTLAAEVQGLSVVLPGAPHETQKGRAWIHGRTSEEVQTASSVSKEHLDEVLAQLREAGVADSDIYLGGFGKGAQMALAYLTGDGAPTLAGAVVMNGVLPEGLNHQTNHLEKLADTTRVVLTHGASDGVISVQEAKYTLRLFKEVGMEPTMVVHPGTHAITPDGIAAVAEFLGQHP